MQFLYANPDPATKARANLLGCGWVPAVPPQFTSVAAAPCVILSGAGQTVVISDSPPTTAQAVATAAAPIQSAEAAAAAVQATLSTNADSLRNKATAALQANIAALALPDPTAGNNTYIGRASPTVAQTNAQVKALSQQANQLFSQVTALTKQADALIRLIGDHLDTTDGT